MTHKLSLGELGITAATDLCALNNDDPPFSFKRDCKLVDPVQDLPRSYSNPHLDTRTYWGPVAGMR